MNSNIDWNDKNQVLKAVEQDPSLLKFVSDSLREDLDVQNAARRGKSQTEINRTLKEIDISSMTREELIGEAKAQREILNSQQGTIDELERLRDDKKREMASVGEREI